MRELFDKYIEWNEISEAMNEEPRLDVKDAVIRKDESVLEISIALNFLVPEKSEARIREAIMEKLPSLKGVDFRYEYIKSETIDAPEVIDEPETIEVDDNDRAENIAAKRRQEKEKAEEKKKKNAAWRRKKSIQRARELPVIGKAVMGGKAIPEEPLPISEISPEAETVVTGGVVFNMESKVIKSGSVIAILYITDKSSSICLKTFISQKKWDEIEANVSIGDYIKVKGQPEIDRYENALIIMIDAIEKGCVSKREDNYPGKHRVELHCHTKMSRLDGLNDVRGCNHRSRSRSELPRCRKYGQENRS